MSLPRKKVILFFLLLTILSVWIILEGLTKDPTFSRLTDFSKIQQLYQPLKNNKNIKIIAAYPMNVSNVTSGFPPNYQLLGQMIHNKTLVGGFDPFTPNGREIQLTMSDILNSQTIQYLTRFKVDTIVIYDQLLDYSAEVVRQLKQDHRLTYLGSYAVPYDEHSLYVSNNDLSRSISIFQINEVVADKTKRPDIYADNGQLDFSRQNGHKIFLTISGIFAGDKVYFKQPYSPHWKLYLKKKLTIPWGISYLWSQPVFDGTHRTIDGYGNSWMVDEDNLPDNSNNHYYHRNDDGSINLELVLYFKTEAYHNLGRLVAATTLLACFGYLLWDWVKRKRGKKVSLDDKN